MRAICGAIITAGALIGLGLTALGEGLRYANFAERVGEDRRIDYVHFLQMDSALLFCLWFFVFMVIVGLIIACLGLMFHHHRRHHELLRRHQDGVGVTPRATV